MRWSGERKGEGIGVAVRRGHCPASFPLKWMQTHLVHRSVQDIESGTNIVELSTNTAISLVHHICDHFAFDLQIVSSVLGLLFQFVFLPHQFLLFAPQHIVLFAAISERRTGVEHGGIAKDRPGRGTRPQKSK